MSVRVEMSESDVPSLFRAEVREARASQRQGKVLIHQPIGYHIAALLALLLVGVIVVFSYYGTYTKKATVRGLLMPEQGLFRLVAPTGGQITAIHAFEGRGRSPLGRHYSNSQPIKSSRAGARTGASSSRLSTGSH